MAVSISQYVDLLFKKLQGVAKTANATVKDASNESIASPAFLRGDVVWTQADQIPATAQAVANITLARVGANSVQTVADTTVPPIGGIRPTWLTNVTYWVPQEFGATWLPKVYVGPPGAANIQATGTQIFSAGIGGVGEYYFDTQAGVLNFIGETIPTVLTSGNVVYVAGYQYVGELGVTNLPSGTNIGNLQINGNTITATVGNTVSIGNNFGVTGNVTVGNIVIPATGNVSLGNVNINNLANPVASSDAATKFYVDSVAGNILPIISNQTISPNGVANTFVLDQTATSVGVLITVNGVTQTPDDSYTVVGNSISFSQTPLTSDIIQVRFLSGTTSANSIITVTVPVALANLSAVAGGRAFVNNANLSAANNFGAQIGSGGSNTVPVWSDGVNWYIG